MREREQDPGDCDHPLPPPHRTVVTSHMGAIIGADCKSRPLQEHPYYASFGYHVSSFFAASSRCPSTPCFPLEGARLGLGEVDPPKKFDKWIHLGALDLLRSSKESWESKSIPVPFLKLAERLIIRIDEPSPAKQKSTPFSATEDIMPARCHPRIPSQSPTL